MIAADLAELVTRLEWSALPAEVRSRARDRVLDALSTAVASRIAPAAAVALAATKAPGPCSLLGGPGTTDAESAAFANAVAVHSLQYDDVSLRSFDHPGAVIVPAALAAGEETDATLADLLTAIVAGYEVELRVGAVVGAKAIGRGFRSTSVVGPLGAAAAAARLFGLERDAVSHALCLAANFAAGFNEGWEHGTMEPNFHAAGASRAGLSAARLAGAGATAARSTFEGRNGYLRAFTGDAEARLPDLGDWAILGVLCKPYPISGGKLLAVDSALEALRQGIVAADVARVTVHVREQTKRYPGSDRKAPFDAPVEAQESTQFCVAAALLGRPMTELDTFFEHFADPDIGALTQAIELVGDKQDGLIALDVELRDGRVVPAQAESRENQHPTLDSMAAKLERLARPHWDRDSVERIVELVRGGDVTLPVAALSRLVQEAW